MSRTHVRAAEKIIESKIDWFAKRRKLAELQKEAIDEGRKSMDHHECCITRIEQGLLDIDEYCCFPERLEELKTLGNVCKASPGKFIILTRDMKIKFYPRLVGYDVSDLCESFLAKERAPLKMRKVKISIPVRPSVKRNVDFEWNPDSRLVIEDKVNWNQNADYQNELWKWIQNHRFIASRVYDDEHGQFLYDVTLDAVYVE
jgi:hypothetical protein